MILTFIKSVFVVILSFGTQLMSQKLKCIDLKNQPCLARPTLDLIPSKLCYHPSGYSLNRCGGSCNTFDKMVISI